MSKQKGILYLISTPIGNLEDITIRSLNILKELDIIFCEDTRETANLLNKYDIKKKLISNHNYNEKSNKTKIIKFLEEGKRVGLVSDRGTPVISDPGWEIIKEVINNSYEVVALPGPTALIPALIISGLSPSPFLFYGFLNNKEEKRKKELEKLKDFKHTMIFYEAPHRIKDLLENMLIILGNREVSISREITKQYEENIRGNIVEVLEKINNIKGEIVVVVEGNKESKHYSKEDIIDMVNYYQENGNDLKVSIKKVSKDLNINRNEIYKKYHNL